MTDALLLIQADLMKLLKLKGVWVAILAAILFSCWIQWHSGTIQEGWQQSIQAAQVQLQLISSGHGCEVVTGSLQQHCSTGQVAAARQSALASLAAAIQALRWGAKGFGPLGATIVSLGLLGTGVGFILSIIIGALAMETEMQSGGLKATMLLAARRRLVVMAKAASCYLCAIIGAVLVIIFMIGVSAVQVSLRPLGAGVGLGGPGISSVWTPLLATVVTPAVGVGLALAAGFIGQSSLAAVGGPAGLVVIDRLVAMVAPSAAPYTLVGSIAGISTGLAHSHLAVASVTVTIWPSGINPGGVYLGCLEVLVIAGLGLGVAAVSLRRHEIR